jgi:hypothetical protein
MLYIQNNVKPQWNMSAAASPKQLLKRGKQYDSLADNFQFSLSAFSLTLNWPTFEEEEKEKIASNEL